VLFFFCVNICVDIVANFELLKNPDMKPSTAEYAPFYETYVKTVGPDALAELREQADAIPAFIRNIAQEKENFAYAPGKWSVKEVAGHMIDTERIMAYRALRIARADQTPIPGFEENDYAEIARYRERTLSSLASEFEMLRKANLFLFESFNDQELKRTGTASEKTVSVRALLFIMAGHINHHISILNDRYLK
jgi:hypothetical protein